MTEEPKVTPPVSPQPYAETRWTVWARSIGALLIGVAGLLLSWTGLGIQRSIADVQRSLALNQTRNSAEDLALKHKTFDHQRKFDEAQLAASLVPHLKCDDDYERATALTLLSASAPEHASRFSDLLLQKCSRLPAAARKEVSQIQHQSIVQSQILEFSTRLGNARDYENRGHDGPAARLFEEASAMIPPAYVSKVNREELERAKSAFQDGRFTEAADRFNSAFRAIPNSP